MCKEVLKEIEEIGYSVSTHADHGEFLAFVENLGVTTHIEAIKNRDNPKALLQTNKAMPLHTDHPNIDIISWYCHENSENGGESILVDTAKIFRSLSQEIVLTLRTIGLRVPVCSGEITSEVIHLISDSGVYFASWLIQEALTEKQNDALHSFKQAINGPDVIFLKIAKGCSLSIDNKRMLHGRTEFSSTGSARHLSRHWIKKYAR